MNRDPQPSIETVDERVEASERMRTPTDATAHCRLRRSPMIFAVTEGLLLRLHQGRRRRAALC